MTEHRYCVVMTTTGSTDEAESLAQALVGNKLAACVQLTRVASHYLWDGAPTRSDETLMLIKTHAAKVRALMQYVDEHHSYETPELIEIPIISGLPGYLSWIDDMVL